jgi:hypothetical protein
MVYIHYRYYDGYWSWWLRVSINNRDYWLHIICIKVIDTYLFVGWKL